MKILHTSDWHLGHTLAGYDRTEEQQAMLDQMVDIVREQQPDVMILAGDVYHTSQPATAVQRLFNRTIVRLHDACPAMTIIVTAGNHDSGTKHEIFRIPWECLNVFMIGTLEKDHPESHIIEVPEKGFVIALPYTHERNLQDGFVQRLINETQLRNSDNLPIVLTEHTSIAGADYKGHEDADEHTIGGIDAVKVSDIGEGYDYLALGHIHHAQFVHTGKHNVRYSGSPLPVSFDEDYEHSVSIVEVNRHGEPPAVKTIAISNPHPLTTLPPKDIATWEEAKQLLKDFPEGLPNYIRLNVEITDMPPSAAKQEALQIVQGKQCRFCLLNVVKRKSEQSRTTQVSVQDFQKMSPIEVAQMYAKDSDTPFDEEMQQMLQEVIQNINNQQL